MPQFPTDFLKIATASKPLPITVDVKPLSSLDPRLFGQTGSTEGFASGVKEGAAAIAKGISSAGSSLMGGVGKNVDLAADATKLAATEALTRRGQDITAANNAQMGRIYDTRNANTAANNTEKNEINKTRYGIDGSITSSLITDFSNKYPRKPFQGVPYSMP